MVNPILYMKEKAPQSLIDYIKEVRRKVVDDHMETGKLVQELAISFV